MGTGQLLNLHKYSGHGPHSIGLLVAGEIFFFGCIVSQVLGSMQGHFKIQGLIQGVQHGTALETFGEDSSALTL